MKKNKWILVTNISFIAQYETTYSYFKNLVDPISFKWPNNSRQICDGYVFLEFANFKSALKAYNIISDSTYMDRKLNSIILPDSPPEITNDKPESLVFNDYDPIYPLEIFNLSGEPLEIK